MPVVTGLYFPQESPRLPLSSAHLLQVWAAAATAIPSIVRCCESIGSLLLPKPFIQTFPDEVSARNYGEQLEKLLRHGIFPEGLLLAKDDAPPSPKFVDVIDVYWLKGRPTQSGRELLGVVASDVVGVRLRDVNYLWAESYVSVGDECDRVGRIDVFVSNAGYCLFGAAEELSNEQIDRQIETNLVGSIQVIRAALPHLSRQGGGLVVQVRFRL
jgi:hypothetical protein